MIFWSRCAFIFIWFKNIEKMVLQMTSDSLQLESTLRRHGVEINSKNTVRSFVKIVAKRKKKQNGFNAR
jgi:hypothetical protein